MTPPIALQLYTLRDALAIDFATTIRRVAAMGYAGVEPAGFAGSTPQAAAQLFQELGLTVCAAHSPMPLGADEKPVIARKRRAAHAENNSRRQLLSGCKVHSSP